MTRKVLGNIVVIFIYCFFLISTATFGAENLGIKKDLFVVNEIRIDGIKKVEKEAILEKIVIKIGQTLDNYTLRRDLQRIYEMKYFESVEANREISAGKNILVFKVKEKPLISKVTFQGNNEIERDDLISQLKSKEFAILDVNTVKIDVGALQKFYEEKGFYLASIDYKLKKEADDNIELVFDIKEFDKVKVKRILFLGNKAFTDKELKGIMEVREEGLFSFMNDSGNFKEFNFQTDIERIKYFYKTKGYLQIGVGTPQITISEDKKWVFITVDIMEGPQFSINEITFQGEVLFSEKNLRKDLELKAGEIYSEQTMQTDIRQLTEKYQDEGYAFANVLRTLDVIPGENKVNIEFSFEKGKLANFGKIIIKGNTRTRDKVIRRELLIQEGQKFSGKKLRISKENVNRLGFFDVGSVVFNTVSPPGKDDVLDVEVTVKERNTGQINLGAGYSTQTKGFLNASIAETNFLGRGQNLSFSTQFSKAQQRFDLGFTEPYLMDTKWTAGFDIFRTLTNSEINKETSTYRQKGFSARVGYPIFDYTRLFLSYKFEDTYLTKSADPTMDPTLENGIASSVTTTIVRDTRNNRMEPSAGYYLSFSSEFAGVGGDKKWFRHEADGRYFHNVIGDLVFRSRLNIGKMDELDRKIPATEKYFLGGMRNLRGYYFKVIGPKENFTVPGFTKPRPYVVGGLFSLYGSLELEHPLAQEAGLKWVAFFDAGNVYENMFGQGKDRSIYSDYGVGIRWFSPIGILRFEFAWPLRTITGGDNDMKFAFDIGQIF